MLQGSKNHPKNPPPFSRRNHHRGASFCRLSRCCRAATASALSASRLSGEYIQGSLQKAGVLTTGIQTTKNGLETCEITPVEVDLCVMLHTAVIFHVSSSCHGRPPYVWKREKAQRQLPVALQSSAISKIGIVVEKCETRNAFTWLANLLGDDSIYVCNICIYIYMTFHTLCITHIHVITAITRITFHATGFQPLIPLAPQWSLADNGCYLT